MYLKQGKSAVTSHKPSYLEPKCLYCPPAPTLLYIQEHAHSKSSLALSFPGATPFFSGQISRNKSYFLVLSLC